MSYIKAEDILPREVIELIQQYVDGETIYIPRKAENRRSWGCGTDYRAQLQARDSAIRADHARGTGVTELAGSYHLSEKSIRRILRTREREHFMHIIDYFASENQAELTAMIEACDWSAARFLAQLLREGTFFETLGGSGTVYLLMDGERLVSFATLAAQDSVRDESLGPWIGFVFTVPEYRGRRLAGRVLTHAEQTAKEQGHSRVYIATDYVGLYEGYGYTYLENRIDCWGDDMRILYKEL